MLIQFEQDIQVHGDKESIDEYHLHDLIPLNEIILPVVPFIYKQVAHSAQQEPKLLAWKQSKANDDIRFGFGL